VAAVALILPAVASAQGVLFVKNNRVGIGVADPSAPLHLYKGTAGDLSFRVENAGASPAAAFNFAVNQFGAFTVNNTSTSGQEFSVRQRLDAAGPTMSVQGSVQGTQFLSTSTRSAKTDFQEVNVGDVLESLTALPMTSWRYKAEAADQRHIGPIAEDFQEVFNMGDGEHLSTIDVGGVAIAGIQGLHQELMAKDAEIQNLNERIERLEGLVTSLAAQQ
jgi:hypothetical protein